MRVFCREHKKGFFTRRKNPIRCENRGHVLGELKLDLKDEPDAKVQWQYCCNCEHFSPIDLGAIRYCPSCNRQVSRVFLCDRCLTISFESDTPQQTKNFTLRSDGAPTPSCPGCLQEVSAALVEHDCVQLGRRVMTPLNSCPICLERLDVDPVPPASVAAGQAIEPVLVEPVSEAWRMESMVIREVVDDQPTTKPPVDNRPDRWDDVIEEKPPTLVPMEKEKSTRLCKDCGSLMDTRYGFCWKCGNQMIAASDASPSLNEITLPSGRIVEDEHLATGQNLNHIEPIIFSWASPEPSDVRISRSTIRVLGIIVGALLLIPFGLLVLTRSASYLSSHTASQPPPSSVQSDQSIATRNAATVDVAAKSTQVNAVQRTEEDELRQFREQRVGATGDDRVSILQAFIRTEKQYPNDYRFPYERAKLAINMAETRSHYEAFNALSLAAEKAIRADKAQEMLEALEADRTTDFHKLSHGHREWNQIVEALKSKNTTLLGMNSQF